MRKSSRTIHKWTGLISCIFIIIVSLSAIALNHHDLYDNFTKKETDNFSINQIKKMSVDPFNSQHIIASDENKLLFSTNDNGKTWSRLELFVPTQKVNNISFDPFEKDKVVVSLKEAGLYISDDGGEIWDEIKLPFFPNEGEYIENVSLSKDIIQVKSRFGLYTYDSIKDKWINQTIDKSQKQNILSTQEFIYNIHTGKIFGDYGIIIYDIISIGLILLSISGIILSIRPKYRFKRNLSKTQNLSDKNNFVESK
jgi:hypothetical protein